MKSTKATICSEGATPPFRTSPQESLSRREASPPFRTSPQESLSRGEALPPFRTSPQESLRRQSRRSNIGNLARYVRSASRDARTLCLPQLARALRGLLDRVDEDPADAAVLQRRDAGDRRAARRRHHVLQLTGMKIRLSNQ